MQMPIVAEHSRNVSGAVSTGVQTYVAHLQGLAVGAIAENYAFGAALMGDDIDRHTLDTQRRKLRVYEGLGRDGVLPEDVGDIAHGPAK